MNSKPNIVIYDIDLLFSQLGDNQCLILMQAMDEQKSVFTSLKYTVTSSSLIKAYNENYLYDTVITVSKTYLNVTKIQNSAYNKMKEQIEKEIKKGCYF